MNAISRLAVPSPFATAGDDVLFTLGDESPAGVVQLALAYCET